MKKTKATARIYTFDDTTIYTITTADTMTVYRKPETGDLLEFVFAVDAATAGEIDIEDLHDCGYF